MINKTRTDPNKNVIILNEMKKCAICQIRKYAKNVVIGRGAIPAKVLFIGEAPGKSEDLLGQSFVGISGNLLNALIQSACEKLRIKIPSCFFINCVMCRPTNEKHGDNREPSFLEVMNCSKNVNLIIKMINPRIVVCVGKVAEKYYKKEFPYCYSIQHPSYILRQGGVNTPAFFHNVKLLYEALKEI